MLFEYEAIKNLPPQLKELIKLTTGGKELSPADYDKLFAIIKKLEQLPPGLIGDYASKVTKTTTDLDAFDASIDRYIAEMAGRTAQAEERDKIQTKLAGLEEVYKKYQTYKLLLTTGSGGGLMTPESAGAGLAVAREAGKLREELDAELPRYGFAGVTEFEAFIRSSSRRSSSSPPTSPRTCSQSSASTGQRSPGPATASCGVWSRGTCRAGAPTSRRRAPRSRASPS